MKFEEIIELERWQSIQDILASIINISLRTVNKKGEIITRPSAMAELCSNVLNDNEQAVEICWQWFPEMVNVLGSDDKLKYYERQCPFKLINFVVPFDLGGEQSIYLVIGPINFENKLISSEVVQVFQEQGVDPKRVLECLGKLPQVRQEQLQYIVDFLRTVVVFLTNKDTLLPANEKGAVNLDKETIGKLLKSFLELSTDRREKSQYYCLFSFAEGRCYQQK